MNQKDTGIAYVFLILPSLFFIHGIHRFYLGKPVSGFFYLITMGWFFIGTFIDLFTLGSQVRYINMVNDRLYYRR
jgi:TM2 domain-containing membrane protein YozV